MLCHDAEGGSAAAAGDFECIRSRTEDRGDFGSLYFLLLIIFVYQCLIIYRGQFKKKQEKDEFDFMVGQVRKRDEFACGVKMIEPDSVKLQKYFAQMVALEEDECKSMSFIYRLLCSFNARVGLSVATDEAEAKFHVDSEGLVDIINSISVGNNMVLCFYICLFLRGVVVNAAALSSQLLLLPASVFEVDVDGENVVE